MGTSKDFPEEIFELINNAQNLRGRAYRGRFAPSPTGPLHLGNLRTALVSWLRARLEKGEWILRIDDLDTPRNRSGAVESIQKDLIWLGLPWDGQIVFQSKRRELYQSVLDYLKLQGKLYPCCCTRRVLVKRNKSSSQSLIYPGTCRNLGLPWTINRGKLPSLRLRVGEDFAISCGDIILRRSDGFIAYHLATVVDELCLGINEVVRGNDLAKAMPAQLAVFDALGQKPLRYRHVPLLFNADGTKMSKRLGGEGLVNLRNNGFDSAEVIGLLAASLGLIPEGLALSTAELLSNLMKRRDVLESVVIA